VDHFRTQHFRSSDEGPEDTPKLATSNTGSLTGES
jgi:hypothetical protein